MPFSPLRPLRTFSAKLLIVSGAYESMETGGIPVSSVSHRKGSRSSTILSLNNLITTKLHTLNQIRHLLRGDLDRRLGLAEKRNDGLSRVATNDWDSQILRILRAHDLSDEGFSTDDIEGGNTEEALGVEDSLGLEDLGGDGDGRVDRVRDDQNVGFGGDFSNDFDEAFDDTGVDVEEIITSHSWLACVPSISL
jgi:hypothetical protein